MSTTTTTSHQCAVCQQDAKKRCSRCKSVWYCTAEHQKSHWKTHHRAECNDAFQADQYTLHKQEFDRIVKAYKLDSEEKSEQIATFLTQQGAGEHQVSAPEFADKFGLNVEEAVVFLEWIKVGVKFKESAIDAAKKAGLSKEASSS